MVGDIKEDALQAVRLGYGRNGWYARYDVNLAG